jgi:ABC-type nitrate/sulfonate/bicarbonate transport system substrate-binding protein
MKKISILFLLSVLWQSAAVEIASSQTLKRIKIGYPSLSFRQSNVWVAREMGLFNKYGLEVEPILFRGGQVATQALVSGDPPIVNIGTVVQATIQGHNIVLVAAVENKYDLIVFTRPGITRLEELRGKRIGITGFNSATHYASIIVARHIKADVKELTLIPAGLDTERIASVTTGVLDATYVATSAAPLARKAGLTEIVSVGDLGVEVQGNGFATSRAYIAANRDTVKTRSKALSKRFTLSMPTRKKPSRSSPNICAPTIPKCSKSPTTATSSRSRKSPTRRSKASSSCSTCSRRNCPTPRTSNPSSSSI